LIYILKQKQNRNISIIGDIHTL